jgi:hypothetical protein
MGILDWLAKLRHREDEETLEREVDREHDTPEERRLLSGDIDGIAADERAARSLGEGSIEDVDRLGDGG